MRKIQGIVIGDLIEIARLLILVAVAVANNKINKAVAVISTLKNLQSPSTFVSGQRTR
jgi:hypothetical protein